MQLRLLHLLDGARRARGLAVVIDVFRAFSTACHIVAGGAKRLLVVERAEDAFRLKHDHPEWRLVGERGGRKIPGFEHGNSPSEIREAGLAGATVVLTTSAGTRGLLRAATTADEVVTGSFVNAAAVIEHVRRRRPDVVSIVCLGSAGTEETAEDNFCGEYLKAGLGATPGDFAALEAVIRASASGLKFLDPEQPWFPPEDLELCLELDRFDFALCLASRADGTHELVPIRA